MENKAVLVILLAYYLALSVKMAQCIVCPESLCSTTVCEEEKCGPGQILRPGGPCNCCDVCYTILREGEPCHLLALLGPQPPRVMCGENLICFQNKCQKEQTVVSKIAAQLAQQ